jgi:hypothetical protein
MLQNFFIYISLIVTVIYAETSQEKADRLGKQISTKYGTASALQTNINTPMQTDTQLTTLDGDGFSATLTGCESTTNTIKISFVPQSTNLFSFSILQDGVSTLSKSNIVGVCSDGYITSSTGSWDSSINYFKWYYDSVNNFIGINSSTKASLAQCQCTLMSCGYTTFEKTISDTIVSGIISTINNTNTNMILSSINDNNNIYDIVMTNNSNCQPSNKYTSEDPQSYYSSQTIPPIDNATVAAKDGDNPSSLYNLITPNNNVIIDSSNDNIKIPSLKECYIVNKVYNTADNKVNIKSKNNCDIYENNANCSLKNKIICDYDGVSNCMYVIKNSTSTNAVISSHCVIINNNQVCDDGSSFKVFENGAYSYTISSQIDSFFYIKKVYDCGITDNNIDRSNIDRSLESVTRDEASNDFSYVNQDGVTTKLGTLSDDTCIIRWCSVQTTEIKPEVFSDNTNQSDTVDGSTTSKLDYKQCEENNPNIFTCPLGDNDTLVEDCSCEVGSTGLAQAFGAISAVEEIVGDFTCSK